MNKKDQQRQTLLSVGDVSERWGLPLRSVYNLIDSGRLAHVRVGRRILVNVETVQRVERGEVEVPVFAGA